MAQDDNGGHELTTANSSAVEEARVGDPGTAVVVSDALKNPGFPPHRPRVTDLDPKKQRRAERTVFTLFYLSIAGSIWAIAAYLAFPIIPGDTTSLRLNNL